MARFLNDEDYDFKIKSEILKLLDGSTPELATNKKLLKAEAVARAQIRNRLAGRFDCETIFLPKIGDEDPRDQYIINIFIDITLYHLYSQTGSRDIPEHRKLNYQDAIEWLTEASLGNIPTDLPTILSEENEGDIRIWSQSPPENHDW